MGYNQYVTLVFIFRTVAGIALSLVLGALGVFVVSISFSFSNGSWPVWIFTLSWFSAVGLGAVLGSFLAWMNLETSRTSSLLVLVVLMLAGLGGAWGGFYYKVGLTDSLTPFTGRAVSSTAIFGAAIATNLVTVSLGLLGHIRSRQ